MLARLAQLSQKGREVAHFLMWAANEGLSGAEVLEILRMHGLGYRTQDFYNDWRIITSISRKVPALRSVRWDRRVSFEAHEPAEFRFRECYVYTVFVDVECYNCATRAFAYKSREYITLRFDYRPTRAEACRRASELWERTPDAFRAGTNLCCRVINCGFELAYLNVGQKECMPR